MIRQPPWPDDPSARDAMFERSLQELFDTSAGIAEEYGIAELYQQHGKAAINQSVVMVIF